MGQYETNECNDQDDIECTVVSLLHVISRLQTQQRTSIKLLQVQ
jgi:hypothetical protein